MTRRQLFRLAGFVGVAAILPPARADVVMIVSSRRLVSIVSASGEWTPGVYAASGCTYKAWCFPGLKLVTDPYMGDRQWASQNEAGTLTFGHFTGAP